MIGACSTAIFWVLRSGAPWRDLPVCYGPRTTCYNRFVQWRKAGVWDRIMDSLAAAHDATVQMIDTQVLRAPASECLPRLAWCRTTMAQVTNC
jgi:transposase